VESLGPSYPLRGLPLGVNNTFLKWVAVQLGLVPDLI